MKIKVAINGMGETGRELFRTLLKQTELEIVLINDLRETEKLVSLLKDDCDIAVGKNGFVIDGKEIRLCRCAHPEKLPLKELGVDLVINCVKKLNKSKLQGFIRAGAKKVIACNYTEKDLPTVAPFVKSDNLAKEHTIVSIAPLETHIIARILNIFKTNAEWCISRVFGAVLNKQSTVCANRAIVEKTEPISYTPTNSAAAEVVGFILPELQGKVFGYEYRYVTYDKNIFTMAIKYKEDISADEVKEMISDGCKDFVVFNETLPIVYDDEIFDLPQILTDSIKTEKLPFGNTTFISLVMIYDRAQSYCRLIGNIVKQLQNECFASADENACDKAQQEI